MRASLICKLCSLDRVTSRPPDVNKHGDWVNNLNPFTLDEVKPKQTAAGFNKLNPFSVDTQKKYDGRAHNF